MHFVRDPDLNQKERFLIFVRTSHLKHLSYILFTFCKHHNILSKHHQHHHFTHTQTLKNLKCISVASARSLLSNQLSIKATSNALFIFPHVPHIPFLNESTYDAEHYLLVASCLKLMSFYMLLLKRGMVSRTRWYLKELWCSQTFNVDFCNKTFNLKENRFKSV